MATVMGSLLKQRRQSNTSCIKKIPMHEVVHICQGSLRSMTGALTQMATRQNNGKDQKGKFSKFANRAHRATISPSSHRTGAQAKHTGECKPHYDRPWQHEKATSGAWTQCQSPKSWNVHVSTAQQDFFMDHPREDLNSTIEREAAQKEEESRRTHFFRMACWWVF